MSAENETGFIVICRRTGQFEIWQTVNGVGQQAVAECPSVYWAKKILTALEEEKSK